MSPALKPIEAEALAALKHKGSFLISQVPEKTIKGDFGERIPGLTTYRRLDKMGLVIITEEEEDEEGFSFTPQIDLTEAGEKALRACHREASGKETNRR